MTFPTVVLGVPIDCSGRFTGCELAPAALRAAGLVERLNMPDMGNLLIQIDDPVRDPETGLIGFSQVEKVSQVIRAAVHGLVIRDLPPLLLGGCCTLLIGTAAAMQDAFGEDVGLIFIDGHADCYDGTSSPTGEAADMDLAIVTGRGPNALTAITGKTPLIRPDRVVMIGVRDMDAARSDGSPEPHADITVIPASELGGTGLAAEAAARAMDVIGSRASRFWLHLDLDVLSSAALPAVDYPIPGGLDWDELYHLTRPLLDSPACVGMDVTIYNPSLDHEGQSAQAIVEFLASVAVDRN